MARVCLDAMMVQNDALSIREMKRIVERAAAHRLPAISRSKALGVALALAFMLRADEGTQ